MSATLRRFAAYLEKRFSLTALARALLREGRPRPQIPLVDIFRSVLLLFAQRLPSLNALEEILRRRGGPLVSHSAPSADTIGYAYARMDPEGLRDLLVHASQRGRRNKTVRRKDPRLPWTVAVDGHELFSSYSRCCGTCQQRELSVAGVIRTQYYHQIVKAQLVEVEPVVGLDAELIPPGENELTAARRLIARVLKRYPFVEVLTLDAMYLSAAFVRPIVESGRVAIVVLKGKHRQIYQDFHGLIGSLSPEHLWSDGEEILCWDLPGFHLEGWRGAAVRVVRTVTRRRVRRRVAGQWTESEEIQDWTWAVFGPSLGLSTLAVHRLGHGRWEIENQGFNEDDRFFSLDHCFKHDPVAIVNFILTLFLAATLSEIFFTRNLKAPVWRRMTLSGLARMLLEYPPQPHAPPIWSRAPP